MSSTVTNSFQERMEEVAGKVISEVVESNLVGEKLPSGYSVVEVRDGSSSRHAFISPRGVELREGVADYNTFYDFKKQLDKKWVEKFRKFVADKAEDLLGATASFE